MLSSPFQPAPHRGKRSKIQLPLTIHYRNKIVRLDRMARSAAGRLRSRHDTLYGAAGHIHRQRADILITPRILQPVDLMGLERPEVDRVVGIIVGDALGIRVGEDVVVFAWVHGLSGVISYTCPELLQ